MPAIRGDLHRYGRANVMLETVDQVTPEREPNHALYRMLVGALTELDRADQPLVLGGFLLKLLSLPILIVTLGLFIFVINALMLRLTGWVSGLLGLGFYVEGFWAAFLGGLIVSAAVLSGRRRDVVVERRDVI